MNNVRKGFTLIELVVVVLIMGILASMGIPYYYKTVETSKATDSVAIGHMLANANRMFRLDNPSASVSGSVTNTCNSAVCASVSPASPCRLIACGYVAQQDWNNSSYDFYVCNNGAGGGYCGSASNSVASTRRKPGASADYSGWGYVFTSDGGCQALGGPGHNPTPPCPKF